MKTLKYDDIHSALAYLTTLGEGGKFVLVAPTGTGKSTIVPMGLAANASGRVIVVEPRRVAARSLARYVAGMLGEEVGGLVGYWVRFDNRAQEGTKLTFMTEGIFLQVLRMNPDLEGVSTVVFDEFHERSIFSDTALALVKALQKRRPDLQVGVMSATLESQRVADHLSAPVIQVGDHQAQITTVEKDHDILFNGRHHVKIYYRHPDTPLSSILAEIEGMGEGGVLIFEPGKGEIAATMNEVQSVWPQALVLPLHSEVSDAEQDLALRPAPAGVRKVVVATNIAETSLTVPDVKFVIDRGLERVYRYDHDRGFSGLFLMRIARDSADQRAGRCGRVQDGVVFRLWTREMHQALPATREPEIKRVDLAGLVLMLKGFGVQDVAHLDWLDHPGVEAIQAAEDVLRTLGALDENGRLTKVGRQMARLPLEPHLARMVVEAQEKGGLDLIVKIAALRSVPRVFLRPRGKEAEAGEAQASFRAFAAEHKSDLFALVAAYEAARQHHFDPKWCREHFVRCASLREAHDVMAQLRDILRRHGVKVRKGDNDPHAARRAIVAGLADELWERYWGDRYRRNGFTALRARESAVDEDWVVASDRRIVQTRRGGEIALIQGLTAVDPTWLPEIVPPDQVEEKAERPRVKGPHVVVDRVVYVRGQEVLRDSAPYEGEGALRVLAEALAINDSALPEAFREVASGNADVASRVAAACRRNKSQPCSVDSNALLVKWYEEKLQALGGNRGLEGVSPKDLRLTDEDVSALIGHSWPEYEEETFRVYPDKFDFRGRPVPISYGWGDTARIKIPAEVLPEIRDEDIPALPGYKVFLACKGEEAKDTNGLRERVARQDVYSTWPQILDEVQIGAAVEVHHPGGEVSIAGYWGLKNTRTARVFPTREGALDATRKAVISALIDALNERLHEERGGEDVADLPLDFNALLAGVDLAALDRQTMAGLEDAAALQAQALLQEWLTAKKEAPEMREQVRKILSSPLNDNEGDEELQHLAEALKQAVYHGNIREAIEAYRELKPRLVKAQEALQQKQARLEAAQARLEALEREAESVEGAEDFARPLIDEARDALDTGMWGSKVPDLDKAETLLDQIEAGLKALAASPDVVQEAMEYLASCPLCGEEMGPHGCYYTHDEDDMAVVVDFSGEEAILFRLVTDAGDTLAEVIAGREGGDVKVKRFLPTRPLQAVRYERVALLPESAREVLGRLRDLEWEIKGLEEALQEWAPDLPTTPESLKKGKVIPNVAFRQGEHKGQVEWSAHVRLAGRAVKLIVGRWQAAPDPDRVYSARVVKVLVNRPDFAVALVEIKDTEGLRRSLEAKRAAYYQLREGSAEAEAEENTAEAPASSNEDVEALADMLAATWGARIRKK